MQEDPLKGPMAACALLRRCVAAASVFADDAETRMQEGHPRQRHHPEVASHTFPASAGTNVLRDDDELQEDQVAPDREAVTLEMLRVLHGLPCDEPAVAHAAEAA